MCIIVRFVRREKMINNRNKIRKEPMIKRWFVCLSVAAILFSAHISLSIGSLPPSGYGVVVLSRSDDSVRYARCSPNRRFVCFVATRPTDYQKSDVYVVDLDQEVPSPNCLTCSNEVVDLEADKLVKPKSDRALSLGVGYSSGLSWSPDSTRIKIVYEHFASNLHFAISVDSGDTEYLGMSWNVKSSESPPGWIWVDDKKHTIQKIKGARGIGKWNKPNRLPRKGSTLSGGQKVNITLLTDTKNGQASSKRLGLFVKGKSKRSAEKEIGFNTSKWWLSRDHRFISFTDGDWKKWELKIWDSELEKMHRFDGTKYRFIGWANGHMIAIRDKELVRIELDK